MKLYLLFLRIILSSGLIVSQASQLAIVAQLDDWELVFEGDVFNVVFDDSVSFLNTRTSVYRSWDEWQNWEVCNWPLGIVRLVDGQPTSTFHGLSYDGDHLVVSALDNGFFISEDFGESFEQTGPSGFGCASSSILSLAGGGAIGTMGGFQRGIWKTEAETFGLWQMKHHESGDQQNLILQNEDLYAITSTSTHQGGILSSTDAGENWALLLETTFEANPKCFYIDDNNLVYLNYNGELITVDIESWSAVQTIQTVFSGNGISAMEFYEGTTFLASEGGVFISQNAGVNWEDISPCIGGECVIYHLQFYSGYLYACTSQGLLRLSLNLEGCMDELACNYDMNATQDDGGCIYPINACEVCDGAGGVFNADADGDGVCDQDEIAGCPDSTACNYDPVVTDSDGSCIYPNEQCEACDGAGGVEALDDDGDGVPNCEEILGCTEPGACNFDPAATEYDWSCQDFELCGNCMNYSDFENITCLELYGLPPGTYLCTDSTACNYSGCEISSALEFCPGSPYGSVNYQLNCIYPPGGLTCEEYSEFDTDGDGVFDINEVTGCTYPQACNYAPWATDDNGTCMIPGACEECFGYTICTASIPPSCSFVHQIICTEDENLNLICDCEEEAGCTDELACNYDAEVTLDDGTCVFPVTYRNCLGHCLNDTDGDEVCDEEEVSGCTDETAINFDPDATNADQCYYPEDFFDETCAEDLAILQGSIASGEICGEGTVWSPVFQTCLPDPSCLGDLNVDGVIGTADLLVLLSVFGDDCEITGCTVPYASNFNPDAAEDNWTCAISGCSDPLALNYLPGVNVPSNDNCIYGLIDSTGSCLGMDQIQFNNHIYPLVEIGEHCWFKENLRTTSFRDGSNLFLIESGAVWGNQISAAATTAGGSSMLGLTFGLLYNWHAVADDRGLCPNGWYPADSAAWNEAISIAGGPDLGAPAMRVPGNQIIGDGVWEMNNEDASNITGFSALPAGYRLPNGNYGGLYSTGQFWGGESLTNTNARSYYINQSLTNVGITQNSKSLGLSVRCTRKPIVGCTDPIACNFNPSSEIDSGDCAIATTDDCGCVFCGDEMVNDSDQDGICDTNEISICTDPLACNFVDSQCEQADNAVCVYPANSCDYCDGNGGVFSSDSDGDGVCDPFLGCMNNSSLNFNPIATIDNGSCLTIPDSINYCEYFDGTEYNSWIDEEELYVWVHRLSSQAIEEITGVEKFYSNPYAHNRLEQELYSVSPDADSLYVLHLDTWSIEVRDVSGWEGNLPYNDLVYNPSDHKIYAVRSGLDRMNKVNFTGGVWELSTNGSFDAYRYGAKRFYNGIENVIGTHGGYGVYQSRRDVHFAMEPNYSLIIPNTSNVEPYKRHNHAILPSADYHAAFVVDGRGSSSGDQLQNSCDIPGGYDYATDIGDFCWLRDLWRFDFTSNEFQEILPVNTDFPARGTYGFDFDMERFWCFGGYLPQQAYGDNEPENSNVYRMDLADIESGWEQTEVNGDAFEFSKHAFSVYNPVSGNMVVFNDSGVWEMASVSNEIEVTWAVGLEELTSSTSDPNEPTFQQVNVVVNGQVFTDSIFVTPAELGCTIECAVYYSPSACVDDGSCQFQGVFCPDIDPEQDFCEQWNDCLSPSGCMDFEALNYDPQASIDDGSCEY